MIHHISISAHNPQLVAEVIAQVIEGKAFPFSPVEGGFITLADDGYATAVEVYPISIQMQPATGDDEVLFVKSAQPAEFIANHAAISVKLSEEEIKAIAKEHGWRAVTCSRGGGLFHVVEFWLENRLLIEFLTPEMAKEYVNTISIEKWAGYLEQGIN